LRDLRFSRRWRWRWVVTPCSDMIGYRRFGAACCLQLQAVILPHYHTASQPRRLITWTYSFCLRHSAIWGCIQKFPDWVYNEIYAYLWYYSLRSNTKGYGDKTRQTDSQHSDTTEPNGRELYHLQFSLQAAGPESFGYTFPFLFKINTEQTNCGISYYSWTHASSIRIYKILNMVLKIIILNKKPSIVTWSIVVGRESYFLNMT
jgi:hypothetical protein